MQTIYFYIVTISFLAGVLLASLISFLYPVVTLIVVMALGLLTVTLRTRYVKTFAASQKQTIPILTGIGLCLLLLSVGMLRFMLADAAFDTEAAVVPTDTPITLQGKVIREPDVRETATLLTVATEDTRVLIRTDRYSAIGYGDMIAFTGKLASPESFVTDYGRTFDYEGYLRARGITHTMSFVSPTIIEADDTSLLARLYAVKAYFLERLALVLSPESFGLGAGLLLGVQSALGEELIDDFRAAGVVHIVVLSGYNIMLVVAFILLVTAFLLPFRLRLLVSIVAVIVFALLVGFSPSVLRASTMAVLFLLVALLARPHHLVRTLILAATLMVFINPHILFFDIGFQLSCLATLGLILGAPQFEQLFHRGTAWFSVRTFLIATVATQIAVLPLILYQIGEWSLVAIPANLLIVPLVPFAMLLTFLSGLLALVSTTLALPVALGAEAILSIMIYLAGLFAALPFATVTIPAFSGYLVPVLYVAIGGLWYWWQRPSNPMFSFNASERSWLLDWEIVEESSLATVVHQKNSPVLAVTKTVEVVTSTATKPPIFFR